MECQRPDLTQDQDFQNFMREFFDNSYETNFKIWHDGFDTYSLRQLSPAKKEAAYKVLIKALNSKEEPDFRVIEGLSAEFQNRKEEILSQLKNLLISADGKLLRSLIGAVMRLEPNRENFNMAVSRMLAGMDAEDNPENKIEWIQALKDFKNNTVIKALLKLLRHENYLVRYHSADNLLIMHGFNGISDFPDILEMISAESANQSSFDAYKMAAGKIRKIIFS